MKKIANRDELAIETRNLAAAYKNGPCVLVDINLKLPAGELIALIGPNGAGKSTFFYLLVGIKKPQKGDLLIFGNTVNYQRQQNNIAYVPQQEQIDFDFPINVQDVVLGGRYGHMRSAGGIKRFLPPGLAGKDHLEKTAKALKSVNLFPLAKRQIGELSGGQKKRVFLARALAQKAKLLLLDEPLTGVDDKSAKLILNILQQMKKKGQTILMITHDINSIQKIADRVILLNRTIIKQGPPETILASENRHPEEDLPYQLKKITYNEQDQQKKFLQRSLSENVDVNL